MENYIETVSGKKFYFLDPKPEDFDIEDIAHALSMMCRFTGHCSHFYSVAEHSWHMSRMAQPDQQFACLLHDASEAYLPDMASPVKQHLPEFKAIERTILSRLFEAFGLDYPMSPIVKYLDLTMLSTEAHYLLPSRGHGWEIWGEQRPRVQHNFRPIGMIPEQAKRLFLDRFYELQKEYELLRYNREATAG